MKKFMDRDFMLNGETAVRLYENYAKDMPICDYHCHLSPKAMYEDKQFKNVAEILLGGDHYKWRYMRSCGVDEEYITGGKKWREKFEAFCACLQYAIGNPLYHWTHLELSRYFNINETVTAERAGSIYSAANKYIEDTGMSPSYLINNSNVAYVCTTDDPVDDLKYHKKIAEKGHIKAKVLPAFRPDAAINIEKSSFAPYIKRLSKAAGTEIKSFKDVVAALYSRIEYFHAAGCRVSDHALDKVPAFGGSAKKAFKKAIAGMPVSREDTEAYKAELLCALAAKYAEKGWVMQLHMSAMRNNNSVMFKKLGPDTGFDSIYDGEIAQNLSRLLDTMNENGALPKTILYTLNPKDNYVLGTMLGNFQSAGVKGRLQFGSGWWFNDQRDGMEAQLRALANLGALPNFVGMLTDSRSFLSYTRHEYFRRILCNLIGGWVENGEFPDDEKTLEKIVKDICFENAEKYFGFNK